MTITIDTDRIKEKAIELTSSLLANIIRPFLSKKTLAKIQKYNEDRYKAARDQQLQNMFGNVIKEEVE